MDEITRKFRKKTHHDWTLKNTKNKDETKSHET